jgi:hypothetical protein
LIYGTHLPLFIILTLLLSRSIFSHTAAGFGTDNAVTTKRQAFVSRLVVCNPHESVREVEVGLTTWSIDLKKCIGNSDPRYVVFYTISSHLFWNTKWSHTTRTQHTTTQRQV